MQNQNNTNPMETGSIPKLLAQLAIPAVVAQVINLLYNIVDRIYIGHIPEIGAAALTGVGLFAPILMLLNAFAMLVGSGGAPRAAIAMGKKDHDTAEKIVGNCFTLLTGLAVILTVLFYISAPTLLKLFGASSATMSYATAYARIYILGSFFVLIVLGMNPFITTQGFAKISMMTTVIGAVINNQLQLWRGQAGTCQKGFFHAVLCMCCLYLYILGCDHALPSDICFYIYCKQRIGRVFFMGAAHLYGWHLFYWFSDKLPAEFHGSRSGKGQPAACLSAKDHPADPTDFYPAALPAG